jgi:ribonuclease HI
MDIYFDGGCTPNPGMRRSAVVICTTPKTYLSFDYGYGTSNEAEWLGLLTLLEEAKIRNYSDLTIFGDSQLVVYQALGKWKIKAVNLMQYYKCFLLLKEGFNSITLNWIKRENNPAGLYLEGKV